MAATIVLPAVVARGKDLAIEGAPESMFIEADWTKVTAARTEQGRSARTPVTASAAAITSAIVGERRNEKSSWDMIKRSSPDLNGTRSQLN